MVFSDLVALWREMTAPHHRRMFKDAGTVAQPAPVRATLFDLTHISQYLHTTAVGIKTPVCHTSRGVSRGWLRNSPIQVNWPAFSDARRSAQIVAPVRFIFDPYGTDYLLK